ncbi:unnamed protein product, partial [Prorocentrum cordatum]
AADATLEGWEEVWADTFDADEPWCRAPSAAEWLEQAVPRTTPKDIIEACRRFRPDTGLTDADWHPRLWRHGGYRSVARVASVLNAVERVAPWPTAPATILFNLMRMAAVGFRNMVPIPELSRVWVTIRVLYAKRVEAANTRAYNWAARADGHKHAVIYFDLFKCFEWVTQRKVWESAMRRGFKPIIMRVVLRVYSMVRRIFLDGCYTEGRAWKRGIVAGSRYAPFCHKMVTIVELDELVNHFPWVDTCLFFDDLAMATHGIREFVEHSHPLLIAAVIYMFEAKLDMAVSKGALGKTFARTSSTVLGKHINVITRRLGSSSTGSTLVPALLHGSSTVGMADSNLNELGKRVATAMEGNAKGRSTALAPLSDGVDPGHLANSSPSLAGATAWQEAFEDMQLSYINSTSRAHSVTIDGMARDLRCTSLQGGQHHVVTTTEKQLKNERVEQRGHQYCINAIFLERGFMSKGRHHQIFVELAGERVAPLDIAPARAQPVSIIEILLEACAFNKEEQTHGLAQVLKDYEGEVSQQTPLSSSASETWRRSTIGSPRQLGRPGDGGHLRGSSLQLGDRAPLPWGAGAPLGWRTTATSSRWTTRATD